MSHSNDLATSEGATGARSPRQSRLVKAALSAERFGRIDVRVRNISESGIGGVCDIALLLGERLMVYLPGHDPMLGIVRWSSEKRFGIETDGQIFVEHLRDAHGKNMPATDQSVEFRIIPPAKGDFRRPAVKVASQKDNPYTTYNRWKI